MGNLLHYETYGARQNVALLLVHALGTDHRFWSESVDVLKSSYYCITPDLQAAGKSPRPDVPVDIPGHVGDLENLRRHVGVDLVVPIGCALGGMVAAAYAARHAERTAALVMTNPGLRNSDAARDMLRKRVEILRTEGIAPLLPAAADRAFLNLPHDARYDRHVERFAAQDPETFARSVLGFIDADISGDLDDIACPTLIIKGEHDVLMPADSADKILERVHQAEVTVMTDAAHFLPFQAPQRFAALVTSFLQRVL